MHADVDTFNSRTRHKAEPWIHMLPREVVAFHAGLDLLVSIRKNAIFLIRHIPVWDCWVEIVTVGPKVPRKRRFQAEGAGEARYWVIVHLLRYLTQQVMISRGGLDCSASHASALERRHEGY